MNSRNKLTKRCKRLVDKLSEFHAKDREFYLSESLELVVVSAGAASSAGRIVYIPAGTHVLNFACRASTEDDDGWLGVKSANVSVSTLLSFFIDEAEGAIVSVLSNGCVRFSPQYRRLYIDLPARNLQSV